MTTLFAIFNCLVEIETISSLAVAGLLLNLVLLVRIKFGGQIHTNLTMKPYIISIIIFAIIAVEFSWLSYLRNVTFRGYE